MIDQLKQIAIFAKTVDHGSFRAAAEALQLSPSVVSHHVAQLEENLGAALLYRTTRKLSLTPEGERLLASAHAMIEAADTGLQTLADRTNQPSGILRVTAPALFAQSQLVTQMAEFALQYPKVELSIDLSELRRDLIADGFDIAIRAGQMKDSSLKAQKIYQFNRKLVAAPAYLKSIKKPDSPSNLKDLDWVELAPVQNQELVFRKNRRRQTIKTMNSRIRVNNAHGLSQIARAGVGMAIIPEYIAEPMVESGELKYVLSDWEVDPINVFAVWPSNAPKDGLIKLLVKYLKSNQQE